MSVKISNKTLYIAAVIFVVLGAVLFLLPKNHVVQTVATEVIPTIAPAHRLDKYKMYDLVNDYRATEGLSTLAFDPKLCSYTLVRLEEIKSDWSHKGFSRDRALQYFKYTYAGENLAKGYESEDETLQNWLGSPGHKKNIVDSNYTRTCLETDIVGNETYTVQEFASY